MQKLVRDRIQELMAATCPAPSVLIQLSDERLSRLLAKLNEQASELARTPKLEECAEVFEVVTAFPQEFGYPVETLVQTLSEKRSAKGRFFKEPVTHINAPTT